MESNESERWFSPAERRLLRYTLLLFCGVVLLALVVFVFWVLGQIISTLHALVFPLAISGVIALVVYPVMEWMEQRLHIPRLAAVIMIFFMITLLLALVIVLVLPAAFTQATQFFTAVPDMAERAYDRITQAFPRLLPMLEDLIERAEMEAMLPEPEEAAEQVWGYVTFAAGMGFVPLYVFFAMLSGHRLRDQAQDALFVFNQATQTELLDLVQKFVAYVTAFFRGQLSIALIMGIIMAVGFTVIGLQAGIFLGLALGLLNIVPYLGAVIGLLTVVPVAYIQPGGGIELVALTLGVIALTQLIESVFLTPKIMADRSGLHPALVVISIIFWGTVLGGVIGMILAVPLTAFLITLGRHLKDRLRTVEPDVRVYGHSTADRFEL